MPGIYVGGLTAAKSPIQLSTHQITHLCTVIHEGVHFDSGRKQIFFRADDSPDENLSRFFEDAVNFIHEARVSGGSVLIHWCVFSLYAIVYYLPYSHYTLFVS